MTLTYAPEYKGFVIRHNMRFDTYSFCLDREMITVLSLDDAKKIIDDSLGDKL